MTWTPIAPKEDGWYWWRETPESKPIVQQVDRHLCAPCGDSEWFHVERERGEWSARIEPPGSGAGWSQSSSSWTNDPVIPERSTPLTAEEVAAFDRGFAAPPASPEPAP